MVDVGSVIEYAEVLEMGIRKATWCEDLKMIKKIYFFYGSGVRL